MRDSGIAQNYGERMTTMARQNQNARFGHPSWGSLKEHHARDQQVCLYSIPPNPVFCYILRNKMRRIKRA